MGEEAPTVSSPADHWGLLGAHSSEEDSFEGEGLEEVAPPTPDPPPEETLLTRLVDLCNEGEKEREEGKVPLSRLMEVMENCCLTYTPQEIKTLSQVYDALVSESKRNGLVNSKGGLEVIVDIRNSQVIRDLLNHYKQNGDHLDPWEPSLSSFLDTSKSSSGMPEMVDNSSTNGVGGASSDSSSAGILTSLEMSLFSCGSREGIAGDFLETEDIEKEAEQLRHSNRKLADEKAQLEKQVALTDDINQQLMQDNKKLLGNVQNMQRQVEQSKEITKEHEETKASLLQSEATARENQRRLQQTEANNNLLNKQLGALSADLEQAQIQLEAAKEREKDLSKVLAEQKQILGTSGLEKAHFEDLYAQESAKFTKAQGTIQELHQVVQLLKQEKQDLEYQLYQSQEEVLQLKQLVGCQSVGAKKAEGEEGGPASDEGVFDEQCTTPPHFSAPPMLPICHETSLTSSPLISSLNGQTPFRGRTSDHLWGMVSSSSGWESSLERRNLFNTLQQNGVHSIEVSESSEELTNLVERNDFKIHELLQKLDDKEELIHDLRSKLEHTLQEQASLSERMSRVQRCLSMVSKAISCSCGDIKKINAQAIRMLESQCGTSALFAQLKTDNRAVNAFHEGFAEDIVSGQINLELQTLRAEIARSQAVLAYLQSRAPRVPARAPLDPAASRRVQSFRRGCSEEGSHPEEQTYDVPYRIRTSTRRTFSRQQSNPEACPACGSDLTSLHSSPLRHSRLFATRSCPALPACEVPITRGTQTWTATVLTRDSQTDVPSVALETVTEAETKEELDSPLPRNRSASFVRAIREGNPNLVDAEPDQARVGCRVEVHREQTPEEAMPARSHSLNMPEVTVEDVDARMDARTTSTRRKCLSEVTRSAAIDLDHGEPVEEATSPHKGQWKRARDHGLRRPMPDLMEGSETESAKGSLEADDGGAFPSFSDAVLGSLGLGKEAVSDQLTEQEIENKFASLSLGFKTDKLTLSKRLELHQRHRDVAEKNNVTELKAIWDLTNALNKICTDDKQREVISKIQSHLEVLQQSTDRISSRAEVYGAVQQEERMCKAFEVMVAHVENLKRSSEKERRELEEVRRLMLDHQLQNPQEGASCSSPGKDSRTRLFSIPSSGTSPALSRLVRTASTIRRCSLPVTTQAPSEDAHQVLHQALKNSATDEEHASDETVPQGAKVGTQQDNKVGDSNEIAADVQNSSATADESHCSSTAPEDSAVLSESTACDPVSESECLEQASGEAEGEDEQETSRSTLAPEDFWAQWATSLLTKLKHWLESSRRALIRKRRPYLSSEAFTTVRYIFSGFLVVAALFSLLMALLPSPTGAQCAARQRTVWELMDFSGPYVVELRWWSGPPPT